MGVETVEHPTTEAAFAVTGMDCASCVAHVEKAARKVGGVQDAQVNLARGRAVVHFDPAQTDVSKIAAAISGSGYVATPENPEIAPADAEATRQSHQHHEARAWFTRAIAAIVLWL